MEFKVKYGAGSAKTGIVLIESDWNLKFSVKEIGKAFKTVLIESDWNLKIVCAVAMAWYVKVLIESDWNLKVVKQE